MKRALYALLIATICVSALAWGNVRVHILDKLTFQNDTPFDIEDLLIKVQDIIGDGTSVSPISIKIPSKKSTDLPLPQSPQKAVASEKVRRFNEQIIPALGRRYGGGRGSSAFAQALDLARHDLAIELLSLGVLIEINIIEAQPIGCLQSSLGRQYGKGKEYQRHTSKSLGMQANPTRTHEMWHNSLSPEERATKRGLEGLEQVQYMLQERLAESQLPQLMYGQPQQEQLAPQPQPEFETQFPVEQLLQQLSQPPQQFGQQQPMAPTETPVQQQEISQQGTPGACTGIFKITKDPKTPYKFIITHE